MTENIHSADHHDPMARGALGAWWLQGTRSAFLLKPDWSRLQTTPANVAVLVLAHFALQILLLRIYISGPAIFYWPTLQTGWWTTAVLLWACWTLVPARSSADASSPPSAVALFAMMAAQLPTISLVLSLIFIPLVRANAFTPAVFGVWGWWAIWLLAIGWGAVAQLALVWRSGSRRRLPRILVGAVLVLATAISQLARPSEFWYPIAATSASAREERVKLTQELIELEQTNFARDLKDLHVRSPGAIHLYAATYAPYADDDVFRRESALVASVMGERFDASGQTIQLVNNRDSLRELPWATPLNLQRTIQRIAQVMDRNNDVIFIHLTSHGARDGKLVTQFSPLSIESVTPQMLKRWLDDAGIRYRIVSVSACYSGSWIEPLADAGTLVMTAADADHTSYGCGSGSTLTYFGRAMFDEELRSTWSFEKAHAAAKKLIELREHQVGKTDGFSNPQIRIGADMREHLVQLEAQRAEARRGP